MDTDSAAIKNVVRFPAIRADSGDYGVVVTNVGRLLIAQGEQVLEVDENDMRLIASHPLSSTIPSVWHFVLSKDQNRLYAITNDPATKRSNIFLAIATADFRAQANLPLAGGAFNFRPFELPEGSKPKYAFTNDAVSKIYVINTRSDNISVIDVNSKAVEKVIDLHAYLWEVYLPVVLHSWE